MRALRFLPCLLALALLAPVTALAQTAAPAATGAAQAAAGGLSIDFNGSGLFTDRMVQIIALVTVLSIAPSLLVLCTSFTRVVIVLSLTRNAVGIPSSEGGVDEKLSTLLRPQLGLQGECPACQLTMACAAQLDADPTLDVWTVSTFERTGGNGARIPAGMPWVDSDDVRE